MSGDTVTAIASLTTWATNIIAMFWMFPRKYGWLFSIVAFVLFSFAFNFEILSTGLTINDARIRVIARLPLMVLLFNGMFFQKVFGFFLLHHFTVFMMMFARRIVGSFLTEGSPEYGAAFLLTVFAFNSAYVYLLFKFGRLVFKKLFVHESNAKWALYSFGGIFSYFALTVYRSAPTSVWSDFLILSFFILSLCTLCFAIITTHEKSKQKYDAEFARSVISSGRDHYEKMNEMQDTLCILRHDIKHHIGAAREMLRSGNEEELDGYLSDVESLVAEDKLPVFCRNAVVNPLLAGYAKRCRKLDIHYGFKVTLPEPESIPNYDLCVVFGNLLENALEAVLKRESGRYIKLEANFQYEQFAIVIENSFDGHIISDDGQRGGLPLSGKKDGGFGLRSIAAVAERYEGKLLLDWEGETFKAYVRMRV